MSELVQCLRAEHKTITEVLFQLLQQSHLAVTNAQQKEHLLTLIEEKLMQLEVLIGGAHHVVEERMMELLSQKLLQTNEKKLVEEMLNEHQLLEVYSELLVVRIADYAGCDTKHGMMIKALDQFVQQHFKHINREQTHLFELCLRYFSAGEWHDLQLIYPKASAVA